jgi:hypothetical protein
MASESEPESGPAAPKATPSEAPVSAKAAPSDRPKKKKAKRPRPPIPRTEEEIDSPTKQTVGMLGILGIMTIIMWAFARGACNYHPPKETRTPRKVTTVELAHDPKNAAVELEQRWVTHDFAGALELATGDVAEQIKKDQAACDAACVAQKPALEKAVLTTGIVVDMSPLGATVRTTSIGVPGGTKAFVMQVTRGMDGLWKIDQHAVDTAPPYVVPTSVPNADSPAPAAPSTGSAAPSTGSAAPSTGSAAPALTASSAPSAAVSAAPLHKTAPAPAASH